MSPDDATRFLTRLLYEHPGPPAPTTWDRCAKLAKSIVDQLDLQDVWTHDQENQNVVRWAETRTLSQQSEPIPARGIRTRNRTANTVQN